MGCFLRAAQSVRIDERMLSPHPSHKIKRRPRGKQNRSQLDSLSLLSANELGQRLAGHGGIVCRLTRVVSCLAFNDSRTFETKRQISSYVVHKTRPELLIVWSFRLEITLVNYSLISFHISIYLSLFVMKRERKKRRRKRSLLID